MLDKGLSYEEIFRKLDMKGFKASYQQVNKARQLGRAAEGSVVGFNSWKQRQAGGGSMTTAEMMNREPYVGAVSADHEAILLDKSYANIKSKLIGGL
eukprot:TRINITY_DN5580_c0_g1_i1.p1 TRINITY_DN5580_c0_g1~~TRINITY_DN5580_c0_g1_i1.p1  ORF type:complete len:104 (+),score=14.74 TRINITY_DN5580_c0_g1_i1:24-314(+)